MGAGASSAVNPTEPSNEAEPPEMPAASLLPGGTLCPAWPPPAPASLFGRVRLSARARLARTSSRMVPRSTASTRSSAPTAARWRSRTGRPARYREAGRRRRRHVVPQEEHRHSSGRPGVRALGPPAVALGGQAPRGAGGDPQGQRRGGLLRRQRFHGPHGERLAKKSNGAELLSQCLTAFFTPLINLINSYRGDVIKFSGDALMIYFPAVDDTAVQRSRLQVPPHGSFGLPDLGPMATAVLRASACCIEIHKRLHMFDTGVDGVCLCLHIGVGCGEVAILQVGGEVPPETHVPRSEYLIAGPPLEQISVAEPLARNGETCVSPQTKYTFPTVKFSAMESDRRQETQFRLPEMPIIRRFVPSAVFKQIEGGTLTYVNEMRTISTIFVSGSGVDVSSDEGAQVAQELMASVQQICYAGEGTLNKFVIDDKGMLFLLVYGLPPLVHTDDPTRAVLACIDLVKAFKRLKIAGRFGDPGRGSLRSPCVHSMLLLFRQPRSPESPAGEAARRPTTEAPRDLQKNSGG
ncbi:unnamed protein product [Prorocentrum cordatum]|uniref:Guanylate cyclase domain-containing protein n=1 Tax=Prorocentrum cordatum TaxID=2364126 RepID=A0ABN9RDH1_9DINO|nr:unnamed protein product [Polarella glacialis]